MQSRYATSLLVLLAFALPAGAASAGSSPSSVISIPRGAGALVINGGPANNDVTVALDRATNEYVVSDRAGVDASENCWSVTTKRVRCERFSSPGFNDQFSVGLGQGDDAFRLLARDRSGKINGEHGDDSIIASAAPNDALGDEGQDLLRARGGPDRVYGGKGHDRLFGGDGADRVFADDGIVDPVIDCGGGRDTAFIDRKLDPRPENCEKVRRR